MVKRSTLTFAELRDILLSLGFVLTKRGQFWFFEHAGTETVLAYRPYRSNERVTLLDVHKTRSHLDDRGLMDSSAFDHALHRVSTG